MRVEVVFALPERQVLLATEVPDGTTVADAIAVSGIARHFPECELDELQAGIWGQPVDRDRVVRNGDRVELFRALEMDPREARRLKAGI
jgi:putative ubiquitin-RnfH superfamily antitoxin RatB of RatAB toxin-antitoxin module